MPVRGSFTSGDDEYNYNVGSFRELGNDHDYVRGITEDRLNSDELDFARIEITKEGDSDYSQWITLYGPYLDIEDIEGELEVMYEEGDYG